MHAHWRAHHQHTSSRQFVGSRHREIGQFLKTAPVFSSLCCFATNSIYNYWHTVYQFPYKIIPMVSQQPRQSQQQRHKRYLLKVTRTHCNNRFANNVYDGKACSITIDHLLWAANSMYVCTLACSKSFLLCCG